MNEAVMQALKGPGMRRGVPLALLLIVIDQIVKWIMVYHVMNPPQIIEVTPFFNLVMAWNTGVSFGMFSNGGIWVSVVTGAIILALFVWMMLSEGGILTWALGCVIGGAIGNFIDRKHFGAVADFLDFHVAGYHWPAFNVADSAIVVGAILLLADSLFTKDNPAK